MVTSRGSYWLRLSLLPELNRMWTDVLYMALRRLTVAVTATKLMHTHLQTLRHTAVDPLTHTGPWPFLAKQTSHTSPSTDISQHPHMLRPCYFLPSWWASGFHFCACLCVNAHMCVWPCQWVTSHYVNRGHNPHTNSDNHNSCGRDRGAALEANCFVLSLLTRVKIKQSHGWTIKQQYFSNVNVVPRCFSPSLNASQLTQRGPRHSLWC